MLLLSHYKTGFAPFFLGQSAVQCPHLEKNRFALFFSGQSAVQCPHLEKNSYQYMKCHLHYTSETTLTAGLS